MYQSSFIPIRGSAAKQTRHTFQNQNNNFFFQPKLTINQPDDIYEQEADAVADKVMRMPAAPLSSSQRGEDSFFKPSVLQRKCAHCEEEEKQMQRKERSTNETAALSQTESYINSLSGGSSLTKEQKSFFESKMGYDFSDVKIHTNATAAKSASEVNALAYTSGKNIVFGEGQFAPETDAGKRLMAHELTHVVQQNQSIAAKTIQRTAARQVACAPGPFTSSGGTVTADPVAFISEAETRAAELIDAAIDETTFTRDRIIAGAEPAWPTIGDSLAFSLTLMGLNADRRATWTGSGIGTVNLLIRRLRSIRSTLVGTGIFYHCDPQGNINMSPCSPGTCSSERADAFSCAGSFKILLCNAFWSQPSLDERAVMLMHEHAHNFAAFVQDSGREGNAECYARFVIEANGLTSSAQSAGLCPNP